jgi:hypothetical protein
MMRLLNVETKILESFEGDDVPEYAVLSHTWGPAREEILFQDLQGDLAWDLTTGPPQDSPKAVGWSKLDSACRQSHASGLQYIWIDTCCIDKSSSAELSEAINSMFRWYANSVVCYAYLADVHAGTDPESDLPLEDFRGSRWFTRGWTLQELLAPADVRFFDSRWLYFGEKHTLRDVISEITKIDTRYIAGEGKPSNRAAWDPHLLIAPASVAVKMSWAANRQTTRVEDLAYCLLGIFDIAMPMLYGEGQRAFTRLQENIMEATDDSSLLAWNLGVGWPRIPDNWTASDLKPSILATSPAAFANCRGLVSPKIVFPHHSSPTFAMTQRGLKLRIPLVVDKSHQELAYAVLACGLLLSLPPFTVRPGVGDDHFAWVAVPLVKGTPVSDSDTPEYWRPVWSRPTVVSGDFILGTSDSRKPKATWGKIVVRRPSSDQRSSGPFQTPLPPFSLTATSPATACLIHAYPPFHISLRPHGALLPRPEASPSTLLAKIGRDIRPYRENIFGNAGHSSGNSKRLLYIRVLDLDLLIHLRLSPSLFATSGSLQTAHNILPHTPELKVYRLPSPASIEDIQQWCIEEEPYMYSWASKVGILDVAPIIIPGEDGSSTTNSMGIAEITRHYWIGGPPGAVRQLHVSVRYKEGGLIGLYTIIHLAYDTM